MRRGLLLAAMLLAGCGPFWDGIGGSSDEIADAVESGKPFRLADVTDFEWDRLYVIPAYSSQRDVERQLGFHWGDAEHSDFRTTDGGSLLAFVRDGEVVEAFDQDAGDGVFVCLDGEVLSRADAV